MNILPLPPRNSEGAATDITQLSRPAKWHLLAPLLALIGGVFGILGAAYTEFFHGSFMAAFVGAPIIEESLKPLGVYLILAKWPSALRNRLYTAFLTMLAGIAFATIENLVYLNFYIQDPAPQLIFWRYTVCTAVHAGCSFIFGFGINQKLSASVRGETRFLSSGKRFFISAMALHSLYNITVVILEISGQLAWNK